MKLTDYVCSNSAHRQTDSRTDRQQAGQTNSRQHIVSDFADIINSKQSQTKANKKPY